jgi:hypothetical protein
MVAVAQLNIRDNMDTRVSGLANASAPIVLMFYAEFVRMEKKGIAKEQISTFIGLG